MDSSLEFSGSVGSVLSRCRTFKVLVIGDSGVGKTCLTHRLCAGEFPDRVEPTIGVDFRERMLEVDGEKIKLQLWDTAGQERFRKSMVQHYYRNVQAVLFVYDVACPASFCSLTSWVEECRQNALGHDVPRFLVGNKSDLRDPARVDDQVKQAQAKRFAKTNGMMCFETSAKRPPNGRANGKRGDAEIWYRQDKVEDIVSAVGVKLKRHTNPSVGDTSAYSGSFKVTTKSPDKDAFGCTC